MKRQLIRSIVSIAIICVIAFGIGFYLVTTLIKPSLKSEGITARAVGNDILAEGSITSANTATLHFQTGGKMVALPFKEGDSVSQGQLIAQLDTYALQRQLSAALNNYKVQRATFDQAQQGASNGTLQGSQKYSYEVLNKSGINGDAEYTAVSDAVKRILDQNQANLDSSVVNIELANYALQLANLTSPINGVITHEDISVPNVNVTTATSFTVADPTALVFRANISENDIDFVSPGSVVQIKLDSRKDMLFTGTVSKIYPQKITLPSGQKVYQADMNSSDLLTYGKFDQSGTVIIKSNTDRNVLLVPGWTVLGHQYIWVTHSGTSQLKKVVVGKQHENNIEIISGLAPEDQIITNPEVLARLHYKML